MERIGFGPRFLAGLIDGVILIVAMSLLGMIFGVGMMSMGEGGFSIVAIILALIPLAYSSTEIFQAATPGKQVMKLKIKNADGTDASREVLQKRWAIKFSSSIINLAGAITTLAIIQTLGMIAGVVIFFGCFMVLAAEKQALHDKLAETAVFKVG